MKHDMELYNRLQSTVLIHDCAIWHHPRWVVFKINNLTKCAGRLYTCTFICSLHKSKMNGIQTDKLVYSGNKSPTFSELASEYTANKFLNGDLSRWHTKHNTWKPTMNVQSIDGVNFTGIVLCSLSDVNSINASICSNEEKKI